LAVDTERTVVLRINVAKTDISKSMASFWFEYIVSQETK